MKILPVLLISIIFYIIFYDIYPKFKETLELVKKFNELTNKKNEIESLENLISSLQQNSYIQQLLSQKNVLNIWLPSESKIEEIIYGLNIFYQSLGLSFKGVDFNVIEEPKIFNDNLLPVNVVNLKISLPLQESQILSFIDYFEKNARLMSIKKAFFSVNENDSFDVEVYYLPLNK